MTSGIDPLELKKPQLLIRVRFTWVTVPSTCSFIIKEQIRGRCTSLYQQLIPADNRASKRHERGVSKHVIAKKCNMFIVLQPLPDGIFAVNNAIVASVNPVIGGASHSHEEICGQFSKWSWTDLKSLCPLRACLQHGLGTSTAALICWQMLLGDLECQYYNQFPSFIIFAYKLHGL